MKFLTWAVVFLVLSMGGSVMAGNYTSSAHGNSSYGVSRSSMSGYSIGNCAHCHEMHASVGGSEPSPASGSPSPFTLFANNFNTGSVAGSYSESDVFCFYCHNSQGSAQQVTNYDYSKIFGCAAEGATSIIEAFNQASQHDLHDVYLFAKNKFSWFGDSHNPCDACHNLHLARRNWTDPDNPTLTAISLPSDHTSLYGDDTTERMSKYNYQAPYCSDTTNYEPGGTGAGDGSDMPDYVTFCQDCHYQFSSYAPSGLNKTPRDVDWTSAGDKHGGSDMDGGVDILSPYSSSGGYVLSCTDCHEPHGSPSIYLIRRRVNGGDLAGTVGDGAKDLGYLCQRCHEDDATAGQGTNSTNSWQYAHHLSSDAPYQGGCYTQCGSCHGGQPINCLNCHFHGGDDSWLNNYNPGCYTGRRCF
ncbi:cytochrome c family protein [Thermosulfidibacter takaii ABI70S6]|uniref:Cytochrome c family protein n=1 Tax=Thermosulfidibacter takaii (strain DSM 17441 / JCM 13301 / NBRC 103674 / ABI70S6) TaxID=1298851 RepID=A0A0S3QRX3_THET7|nr:cytochrome c3 family protein [Thermosulfidibacter takaii]BAT71037.1 cytochrome c family protein [Thermosulfidibacter takaii ABI70S6]